MQRLQKLYCARSSPGPLIGASQSEIWQEKYAEIYCKKLQE